MLLELIAYDLKNYFAKISIFLLWYLLFSLLFITNYFLFDSNKTLGLLTISGIVLGQSLFLLRDDYHKGIYLNYMIANVRFLQIVSAKVTFLFVVNFCFVISSFLLI